MLSLVQREEDNHFPRKILFSEEATTISKEGISIHRKSHVWADENPRATTTSSFQIEHAFNVCTDIIDSIYFSI